MGDYMLTKPSDAPRLRPARIKRMTTRPLSLPKSALPHEERGFVVVRPGDSLVSLAHAKLGDSTRWRELWELNRDFIPNPRTILPGQTLRLPDERPADLEPSEQAPSPTNPQERVYIVRSMDSLSWIAKRELGAGGRWREIWLLNRDRLPSPNLLYPGMALRIPSGAPAPSEAPLPPEAPPLQEPREAKRPLTAVSERRSESDTSPHELHVREVRDRWGETLQSVASELDLPVPVSAALCITEHRLAGFERDGELRIRFERQVFAGRTGQWISNLHRSPSDERLALASALTCDEQAAYASLAMGGAGLMGFRARLIGYASPRAMWEGMSGSEETQIRGLFSLLASEPDLLAAARFEDWIELARLVSRLRGSRSGCAVELERIARSYGGL